MITCSRFIEFDAAHRVLGHENKCRTLHGHRYKVEIVATATDLDDIGRVIDFGVIKELVGGWIDKRWDHTTIIHQSDPLAGPIALDEGYKMPFITDWNPTAENMAAFLLKKSNKLLMEYGVTVIKVVVWETPNCKAEAT